jgi:hypothetical protein
MRSLTVGNHRRSPNSHRHGLTGQLQYLHQGIPRHGVQAQAVEGAIGCVPPKGRRGGGQRSQLEGSLSVLLQGDVREASAKIDVFVFCRVS